MVTQGGWILAGLRPDLGNIMFAFAVSGQALALLQQHGTRGWPLSLMLVLVWLPFSAGSYGLAGVLMLACVTLTVLSRTCTLVPRFWPREFLPLFYAVHLAVIGLMVM